MSPRLVTNIPVPWPEELREAKTVTNRVKFQRTRRPEHMVRNHDSHSREVGPNVSFYAVGRFHTQSLCACTWALGGQMHEKANMSEVPKSSACEDEAKAVSS